MTSVHKAQEIDDTLHQIPMQETPDDKVATNQFSDPHSTVKKWQNLPENSKTTTLEAKRDSQEPVLDK